jgi:transcriptional regulator with PAS, ATPase and Fis domain
MIAKDFEEGGIVVVSAAMQHIQDELRQAARADAKILITGESGVGKEVVARQIHKYSNRSTRPFVAMNCAGVPDSLLESELFGHVRGSFTGAYRDKPGLLEQAHGGTIFMDEVGEMSLRMQALLLRFLEDGDIYRVGSERRNATVNVRVVAATNRVLLDRIATNDFREDLYYRLNVIHLVIPPLRDRIDDVEPLLNHFLRTFSEKYAVETPALRPDVMPALLEYSWPGNVRELKNVAERLIVRARKGPIGLEDLPPVIGTTNAANAAAPARSANVAASALPAAAEPSTRSAGALFERIVTRRESFWTAVYAPFMSRDLTRDDVRALVKAGLQHTRGNYKVLLELFNMEPGDYKRFLNFLRKHQCHMPFQQFRTSEPLRPPVESGRSMNVY